MEESDTYLAIREEGEKRAGREDILIVGEARLGNPPESVRGQISALDDRSRLKRMLLGAVTAGNWEEILETP